MISEFIEKGSVVCLPTDTVYGLVCLASSPEAVRLLYEVKGRQGKPGTIIAANTEQLEELGFDGEDLQKASQYWPGPVSVVLSAPRQLAYLHMGLKSLAVRIPANDELIELLKKVGPLTTTSANRPGEPTVHSIKEAKDIFGNKVALYVDGGTINNPPSTIYRLDENKFTKLR